MLGGGGRKWADVLNTLSSHTYYIQGLSGICVCVNSPVGSKFTTSLDTLSQFQKQLLLPQISLSMSKK